MFYVGCIVWIQDGITFQLNIENQNYLFNNQLTGFGEAANHACFTVGADLNELGLGLLALHSGHLPRAHVPQLVADLRDRRLAHYCFTLGENTHHLAQVFFLYLFFIIHQ